MGESYTIEGDLVCKVAKYTITIVHILTLVQADEVIIGDLTRRDGLSMNVAQSWSLMLKSFPLCCACTSLAFVLCH